MEDRFNELVQTDLPRFWDIEQKKMLYPELREGLIVYIIPNFSLGSIIAEMLLNPNFIRMRPTGLKDKNGKLIYEGDIVKLPDCGEVYGFNAGEIYEIYFNFGGYRFKPKYSEKARGYWLEDDGDCEIIGNIYETPELLEVQNENT